MYEGRRGEALGWFTSATQGGGLLGSHARRNDGVFHRLCSHVYHGRSLWGSEPLVIYIDSQASLFNATAFEIYCGQVLAELKSWPCQGTQTSRHVGDKFCRSLENDGERDINGLSPSLWLVGRAQCRTNRIAVRHPSTDFAVVEAGHGKSI